MTLRVSQAQADALAPPGGGSACAPCRTGPRPATEPGPVLPDDPQDTWLGVILLDDAGDPVPDQDVRIELDTGETLEGRTDREGRVRFEGLARSGGMARFTAIPDRARR